MVGSPDARFEGGGWHAPGGKTTGASLPAVSGNEKDFNAGLHEEWNTTVLDENG